MSDFEMTDEKIKGIMDHVIRVLKPYDDMGSLKTPDDKGLPMYPEYYEGYNMVVDQYESILVHSQVGKFPAKLLGQRSPNMKEDEFNYVKNNYKSWTVPTFIDFLNSVKRMFNRGNYHIIYPEQNDTTKEIYRDENSIRKYLETGIEKYGSLENFIKFLYTKLRLQDVNGCVVVRPDNFIKQLDENADLGFQYYEDTTTSLREPQPYYYNCKRVILPTEDFILIELPEKSEVLVNGKKKKIGRVWELHTANQIFRIYQTGKYQSYDWAAKLMVQHDIGEMQAKINAGLPELNEEGHLYFVAEFLYAVGNLDLVILNKSNLQLANNNGVYPIRVMIGNECDFTHKETGANCVGGYIFANDLTRKQMCPSCNGSGLKTRISVNGEIIIKPKTAEGDQEIKASDAIYSHSTDTTTLEFLMKCIDSDWRSAKNILHLKTDSNTTGENPVESANLSKANAAFIRPMSDQIFATWQWIVDQIGAWREGTDYKKVKIIPPINFDDLTEQDYLNQIKDAASAGAPPFVIRSIVLKFLNTLYYTNQEVSKAFKLITEADDLLTLSDNVINTGQTKGTVANWQVILHNSAPNLVSELTREDPKFFDLDLSEQITKLKDLAKAREVEISEGSAENKLVSTNLSGMNGE